MRRGDCGPLAGQRPGAARLDCWEHIAAPLPQDGEDGPDAGRELRRRLLLYGLGHCLTPAQRQAVELCYGRGLSMTQAARELGLHPSSVSRRLSGALARLRALAGPQGASG